METWCYRRLPMGLICSGDILCERTDQALTDLEGVFKLVEDVFIYADTIKDLENQTNQLFKRCHEHNITCGDSKVQAGTEVQFGGYVVNNYGYKPDPSKVQAIQDYQEPKDLTNLRFLLA